MRNPRLRSKSRLRGPPSFLRSAIVICFGLIWILLIALYAPSIIDNPIEPIVAQNKNLRGDEAAAVGSNHANSVLHRPPERNPQAPGDAPPPRPPKPGIVQHTDAPPIGDHPHYGALDADGSRGYVFDPFALRRSPPRMSFLPSKEKLCKKGGARGLGDADYKMYQHVKVSQLTEASKKARVLCTIYTYPDHHATHVTAARETWGQRCDGFMAVSTKTDER